MTDTQTLTPSETDDTIALVGDSARAFVEDHDSFRRARAVRRTLPGYDPDLLAEMVDLGWTGVLIPEEQGGVGLGFGAMAAILRRLGGGLISEPLTAGAVLAARLLLHGAGESGYAMLAGLADGAIRPALAWQETASSLDPEGARTVLMEEGDGYRLSGRKILVVGAAGATDYLVSAGLGEGLVVVRVTAEAEGVTINHQWRADGTPISEIVFEGVAIDADAVLVGPALAPAALQRALDETTVMICAELVGVIDVAMDMTLAYLRERIQYDRPIGSNQALQHRAVELLVQQELASAVTEHAVAMLDTDLDAAERGRLASRAKARCSDAALRITRDAIQLHGAIGYTDEHNIGLLLKRALVLSAWLGNSAWHRRRFASL